MFNLGFSEFIVIAVVALIVIGPKQLPEVAKVLGRLIGEFKKASQDLSGGLLEVKKEVEDSIHQTRQHIVDEANKVKDSVINQPHQDSEKIELENLHEVAKNEDSQSDGN